MIEKTDVIVMYPADFPICGFDAIVFDSKLKDVFASPRFDALLVDELKKRIIGQRSRTNAEIEQYDRIRFFILNAMRTCQKHSACLLGISFRAISASKYSYMAWSVPKICWPQAVPAAASLQPGVLLAGLLSQH